MRRNSIWLAWLLTAGLAATALAPGAVRAQAPDARVNPAPSAFRAQLEDGGADGVAGAFHALRAQFASAPVVTDPIVFRAQLDDARADPMIPIPLGHDRMENGGLFMYGGFIYYHQTNPLDHQLIAVRGFTDSDGSISGTVGNFIGSRRPALDVADAAGPNTYAPGFQIAAGWRFQDGSAIEVNFMHLFDVTYNHTASLIPPFFSLQQNLSDSFISAPVFNFPSQYAGPARKVSLGNDFAVFGIWNGASLMSIDFIQRFEQLDITWRQPILETDCYRLYGLAGPRFDWIWERFRWRTVSEDLQGNATPTDVGIYSNVVSNRMYGVFCGCGQDWWLGHGFSVSLDLKASILLDVVKERAKFEFGVKDTAPQNKRSVLDYTVVPQLQGTLNLSYNPIEAVQLRIGYDVMAFFNTIASEKPITFDWGGVDPAWNHQAVRLLDGFQASIGFIF
jgi:hypothetical protein